MPTTEELVAAFDDVITGRGVDAFVAALAPGAVIWHNNDREAIDAREHMSRFAGAPRLIEGVEIEHVRLATSDGTFVLQYVVRGTVTSRGAPFEMHNCLVVVTDEHGMIRRVDEYVDPSVGAQLS